MGFGCHKHSLVSKVSLLNLLFSPNLTEGHSSQDWGALGSLLTAQRYAWEKPVPPQHRVRHGCHNTKITTQSRYYLTLLQTASSPIFQSAGGRGRLVTGSLCWRLPSPASFTMVTKWWPIVDLTSAIHALAVLGVTLVVHAYIKGKKKKAAVTCWSEHFKGNFPQAHQGGTSYRLNDCTTLYERFFRPHSDFSCSTLCQGRLKDKNCITFAKCSKFRPFWHF